MDVIRKAAWQGKPVPCFVIDTHVHLMPKIGGSGYWSNDHSLAKTIATMDRLGIDCCVATTTDLEGKCYASVVNEDTARIIEQYPGRVYGHIFINPYDGMERTKEQIARYSQHPGFVSIKFLAGYHGSILQPEYLYAVDFALEAKCPVMFHNWGSKQNPNVAQLMKTRPELKLISAHMGGGTAEVTREYAKMMKDYPNMKMDITGSVAMAMTMEDLVELTGADRWLLGTDTSLHDPSYDLGKVTLSALSDEVKRQILSENYLALLEDSQMGKIRQTR